VGTQLDNGNELPTTFVIPKEGHSTGDSNELRRDISDFTASKVSAYKRLRGGVHLVNTISKNQMGKILYRDLREAAVKLYRPRILSSVKL
jgi:4-coumarate--CoA ligase